MAVEVNTTRKAVEISWDPTASVDPPEVWPPDFPEHPMDPPTDGGDAHPEHPIYLPPYVDNSLPGDQPGIWGPTDPRPGTGLPGDQPEVGKPEFPTQLPTPPGDQDPDGNLPPAVVPHTVDIAVQVFAQGQEGDWSNTGILKNDGLAVLTFPQGFTGESYVEVRALDGSIVDSGTITVS